jgi:hypothetical protein
LQLDPDEIRDYRQEAFFNENKSKALSPVSIFLAVLAAILVSWFIREAYVEWQIKQALEVFNQQMNVMNQQSIYKEFNCSLNSRVGIKPRELIKKS